MFDIAWSELMVIAVIAILVVGPKDLPRMLRAFGATVGKLKRMSNEFQRQFNDALREAELDDVRKSVESIGKIDPLADVRKTADPVAKISTEIQEELDRPATPRPAPVTPPAEANGPPAEAETTDETAPAEEMPQETGQALPRPRMVYRGEPGSGKVGPLEEPAPAVDEADAVPATADEQAERGVKP